MNSLSDTRLSSVVDVPSAAQEQELYRATNVQRALWLQARSDGSSHMQAAILELTMEGDLNCDELREAVSEIVSAHPILGAIPTHDGAYWKTGPAEKLVVTFHDLGCLTAQLRARRLHRLINEQRRMSTATQLFSAVLVREHGMEHKLFLCANMIVADHKSLEILAAKIVTAYSVRHSPSRLESCPAAPLWQSQTWLTELRHHNSNNSSGYWQQVMGRLPDGMSLHPDFSRKPTNVRRAGVLAREIPSELAEQCMNLVLARSCSMSDLFATTFAIVIARFCRTQQVLFGIRTDTRMEGDEYLVGPLTKVLPFDITVGNDNISILIDHVAKTLLDIRTNSHEADVNTLVHRPMLAVTFEYRRSILTGLSLPNLCVEAYMWPPEAINGDLRLCVEQAANRWTLAWYYDSDLFKESTIDRAQDCYIRALKSFLAGEDRPVRDISLLSPDEVNRIIREWNHTTAEYRSIAIHEWVSQQATGTPDRVAVQWDSETLTYAALVRRANKLARYLMQSNLHQEEVIGVCLQRSPEMVVALLAILKAGGAYLPLDPDNPVERLHFMLEDCNVRLVICDRLTRPTVESHARHLVLVDVDKEKIDSHSDETPEIQMSPNALAYVLYTSGSTGKPKGVQVEHRNVVNFLSSMQRSLQITENEVVAQLTPLSFDIAGLELFLPLISGARCVLIPAADARNGQALQQQLRRHEISLVQGTPSTWKIITAAGTLPSSLRKILCGGEALPPQLASLLHVPGVMTWNVYGPTETTIWSTIHRLRDDDLTSIGRPIDNTNIYILDENMRPVPVGVPGELYIGGHGVARGYLNRPTLTSERFVDNPFESDGTRVYRTGDLARYRQDGTVQFLGRADHQVKLHGIRIELGEIETQLQNHPEIACATVLVRDDSAHKWLVAYVIRKPDSNLNPTNLRAYARDILPEYMVPHAFVFMEELPLTPNGKLDRAALPMPGGADIIRSEFVAPSTEMEQTLTTICGEVLQIDQVSVLDNLFDLGGDSLSFLSIATRVQEKLGIGISVQWIFEMPVIRNLAAQIDAAQSMMPISAPPMLTFSLEDDGTVSN